MKKLFSIIAIILYFVSEVFGQAVVDIPLSATEGNFTTVIELAVGLDLTATNGLDPHLGEFDIVTIPGNYFEIAFDLYPYSGQYAASYRDYRPPGNPPEFPYTGIIEHALIWQRSQTGTSINIEYDIPPGAKMRITDQFGGVILNIGPFTGTGLAVIPGTFSLQSALVLMEYDAIIPVELTSFSASISQNEKAVHLSWKTATETNNSGFEIQKKKLGVGSQELEWNAISFVPGFGTTTEPKSYSFVDDKVATGNYKYRLKQIDFDGSFAYSTEMEVTVDFTPKEFVLYQNYPNPFNPSTTIEYSLPVESNVRIKIFNAIGEVIEELVSETQPAGTHNVVWNAQNHSSGIYYYSFEVTSSDGSQSHREMKKIVFLK